MIISAFLLAQSPTSLSFAKRSEMTFKVSSTVPRLNVKATNGSIRIVVGKDGQFVVKVLTRADELPKLQESSVACKMESGTLSCDTRETFVSQGKPNSNYPGAFDYSPPVNEITIAVPAKTHLNVSTSNAAVTIGRVSGTINVRSTNGEIRYAASVTAKIEALSRNGKVRSTLPTNLGPKVNVNLISYNGDVYILPALPTLSLIGGQFWNGNAFKAGNWFVEDGRFTQRKPNTIVKEVNLAGKYIAPAYGDAHTHHIDGEYLAKKMNSDYLAQGTLYVQSMGNHTSSRRESDQIVNQSNSIDVAFANAGITSSWGHPVFLYESLANPLDSKLSPKERSDAIKHRPRTQLGDSYWLVENAQDLERVWPRYLASDPDLTKIFIVNTEERIQNLDGLAGTIGLAPGVVELVVKRARESGLRVYAHIDTAEDFLIARRAHVDGLAHMPGYGLANEATSKYRLAGSLPSLKEMVIQPTAGITGQYASVEQTAITRKLQAKNISVLKSKGARFAIGSDIFFETQKREALAWKDIGFSLREVFQSLVTTTPQSIFPNRAIGRIADGYEGSFVVLGKDPLKDIEGAFSPLNLYKQGLLVWPASTR